MIDEAAVEAVAQNTIQAFANNRTALAAAGLIHKFDHLLDQRIQQVQQAAPATMRVACAKGCSHCCFNVVRATIPEVALMAQFVGATFSEEQKRVLMEKLSAYERRVAPNLGERIETIRPPCPFLSDGVCIIYPVRPLRCRGMNSVDARVCERVKNSPSSHESIPALSQQIASTAAFVQGLKLGLMRSNVLAADYDFGRASLIVLERPESIQSHLEEGADFLPALIKETAHSQFQKLDATRESKGIGENMRLHQQGCTSEALAALRGQSPDVLIRRILVPKFYASEGEIAEWRERLEVAIREFAHAKFEPRQGFDAIQFLQTFEIPYQQMNDRGLLSELGEVLVEKIASKAMPQLCVPISRPKRREQIKVGYISRNLSASNGGAWALGWLKNHAADIETYGFFLGKDPDAITRKFERHAGHFYHLDENVLQNATFIKSLGLDVLIYPDLGMDAINTCYACLRLAPVQCTAWGHPVTSGLPSIDYYLSSELMEPADGDLHYSEKLIRLAGSGLYYEPKNYPVANMGKSDFGLDDGLLFVCCQNPMKLHPKWDHLYRSICEETGRPIVFLKSVFNTELLEARLDASGVNARWIGNLNPSEFLALLKVADASLDTPGWNGGNTTIQALDLKTPVITLAGEFMRGRHSLAFLRQTGMRDAVAKNETEYVEKAIRVGDLKDPFATANPEALYRDQQAVSSLDDFLRWVCRNT